MHAMGVRSRAVRSRAARILDRRSGPVVVRIGLGCAIVAGVCLAQLTATSSADSSFIPGTANASAQAIALSPTTGGLNYSITLATSIAAYQNAQSSALSQTIDLGTIGTALEAEGCNSSPPTLPKSDVPPPVQAESINGNQTVATSVLASSTRLGLGVGTETATATTVPSSSSDTSTGAITVPGGLITVGALNSHSSVAIVNGNTRTATSTSNVGDISIDKGLIELTGLKWTATETSGATTASSGTFTLGALKVAGTTVNLPAVNITTELSIINTLLTAVGLNIQWPAQTTLNDGTIGISPLRIGIDNNTLGQEVIGANLSSVQSVREALVNAILKADCNLAAEITVSDIGVGVLAGGGNLNLDLGGATALTSDAATVSPFGPGGSATGLGDSGTGPIDTGAGSDLGGGFGDGSTVLPGTTTTTGSGGGAGGGNGSGASSLGPVQKTTDCISLGPAGGGCNKMNAAVPIGLIGLALVVALAAWDYIRQRRHARMSGQEVAT
ncbi:MAG TPA: hypothetical protein VHV57_04225 [Acidimicrobiales bacterium]|nr:hypothetical protein [Acidimicrobiales bacterium]